MHETDERLRQAIRAGNIGIFEHDHVTDADYWSPELRRMYVWDADELATLPKIISHVPPEDIGRVIVAVKAAHDPAGEGRFDIEHRIVDRAGTLRWVLTAVSPTILAMPKSASIAQSAGPSRMFEGFTSL